LPYPFTEKKCPQCKGRGVVKKVIEERFEKVKVLEPCDICNGSGKVSSFKMHCIQRDIRNGKIVLECQLEEEDENNT
jgi:DnaJ-class molecular chaperone